jgi:hypothetical protein
MIALDGSIRGLRFERDVPAFPFKAIGSGNGATGRHRTLDGRCFFPARHTTHFTDAHAAAAASREPWDRSKGVDTMRRQLAALVSCAFVATSGAVLAHHSFAMFDQENPVELEGVVQEFKFTSPHSYILLEVKGEEGNTAVWNLEGPAPSLLSRDGWSSQTLKPKDEVIMTIDPLRSGAPGGSWQSRKIKFRNGQPIMVAP